ncbi:hypothetical protein LCGC14_2134700 [marine sediment metagenome]|uniref:Uncharacterized protein n=1 Tax=marine sediment metagenome TaxID=412755 RepID=A0A0F9E0C1_9ZZZZ
MEKLQFGDIETDAVCYVSSGLIAHRPRKDRSTEFSHEELKCIVKCVNSHDGLVKVLEEITVDNCPCSLGRIVSSKAINKAKQALAAAKS